MHLRPLVRRKAYIPKRILNGAKRNMYHIEKERGVACNKRWLLVWSITFGSEVLANEDRETGYDTEKLQEADHLATIFE